MRSKHILVLGSLLMCVPIWSQVTKVTTGNGNWTSNIWSPSGTPGPTDNVRILHNVTINAAGSCSNLTVGNGLNTPVLQFGGFLFAYTFNVFGDFDVNTGASVVNTSALSSANTLRVEGSITNAGSINLCAGTLGTFCNLLIGGTGQHSLSGAGTNSFGLVTLGMPGSGNAFDLTSSTFSTVSFTLTSGLLRHASTSSFTIPVLSIPAAGGIATSASGTLTIPNSLPVSGSVQAGAGVMRIGDQANEHLQCSSCNFALTGGSLNVAGCFSATAGTPTIAISGGTMTIPSVGSSNTTISPFHISTTAGQVSFSGGLVVIAREGGAGAQNLGFLNSGISAVTATGGTLQIGNSATPAGQSITINSVGQIPALLVAGTTAQLSTTLQVVAGIELQSGILLSNNNAISLGGSWLSTGTFVPGTSTVSLISGSPQSVTIGSGEIFNHLHFGGTSVKTFGSPVTCLGNFSIATNATVDVSPASFSLNVRGAFAHSGFFEARSGLVTLDGISQQQISGNGAIVFNDLRLFNLAGCVLQCAASLRGTLSLDNGILNTNSQVFTLVSNAAGTGRVGALAGTGDLLGDLTVQRFIPGPVTGWAHLGIPFDASLNFSQWDDDLTITCLSCPDGYINFPSVYSYDESVSGPFDTAAAYVPITSINDPLVQGHGYWIYVGTGLGSTSDITIDMTGPIRKNNYSMPLSYNSLSTADDDGWNLVHNPYPSPVSWTGIHNSTPGLDNAVYVYNTDLNGGIGGYASYVNGVSSPGLGSGGVGDAIAMCQGFYVHSTGATALGFSESVKLGSNQALLKKSAKKVLRLILTGPGGIVDETVLYGQENADGDFEADFDAYKMHAAAATAPYLASVSGDQAMQINGLSGASGVKGINLAAMCVSSGVYTLSIDPSSAQLQGCVNVLDHVSGKSHDLTTAPYSFYLPDTTSSARFVLTCLLGENTTTVSSVDPTCDLFNGGMISASTKLPGSFTWKTEKGILGSSYSTYFDTLKGLVPGNYELECSPFAGCISSRSQLIINEPAKPTASLVLTQGSRLLEGEDCIFTSHSAKTKNLYWVIDGEPCCEDQKEVSHRFLTPGIKTVKLVAMSASSCRDSVTLQIMVQSSRLSVREENGLPSVSRDQNGVYHLQGLHDHAEIAVQDLSGRILGKFYAAGQGDYEFDLNGQPAGCYLLAVRSPESSFAIKLLHQ